MKEATRHERLGYLTHWDCREQLWHFFNNFASLNLQICSMEVYKQTTYNPGKREGGRECSEHETFKILPFRLPPWGPMLEVFRKYAHVELWKIVSLFLLEVGGKRYSSIYGSTFLLLTE